MHYQQHPPADGQHAFQRVGRHLGPQQQARQLRVPVLLQSWVLI
jgi:hypothetical protein